MEVHKRELWVDAVKGFAILLVILGHLRGQFKMDYIELIIGTLHNPTFYFASGYLYVNSRKVNCRRYLEKHIMRLVVPFIEWSIIFGILEKLIFNVEITVAIIDAMQKLWFLAVLFLCTTTVYMYEKYCKNILLFYIVNIICLIIGCYLSSMIAKIMMSVLIFKIGVDVKRFVNIKKWFIVPILCYIIGIIGIYFGIFNYDDTIRPSGIRIMLYIAVCVFGGCLTNSIAFCLGQKETYDNFKVLRYIGRNSLNFYVLHFVGIYYLQHNAQSYINLLIATIMCLAIPVIYIQTLKKTVADRVLFQPTLSFNKN